MGRGWNGGGFHDADQARAQGGHGKLRSQLLRLFLAAVLENFGYRQLTSLWRFQSLLRWALGARQHWGEMTRSAALGGKE